MDTQNLKQMTAIPALPTTLADKNTFSAKKSACHVEDNLKDILS